MKRYFFLSITLLAFFLSACGAAGSSANGASAASSPESQEPAEPGNTAAAASSTEPSQENPASGKETLSDAAEFHRDGVPEFLPIDSFVDGYASSTGYYRMIPRSDASNNVTYIDFASQKEIYLCSQPNCTHSDASCVSWFPTAQGLHRAIPVGDKLLVIHGGASYYADLLGDDSLPSLDVMELDGGGRQRLCTFSSNCKIAPLVQDGIVRDNENLYFCLQTDDAEETTRTLCAANGHTGQVFQLTDLPEADEKIIGTDSNALIVSYMTQSYELGMDPNEVKAKIARYDLDSQAMTDLLEHDYTDAGICMDGRYWALCSDSVLRSYDLLTGNAVSEQAIVLPEGLDVRQLLSDGCYDGKWLLHGHIPSSADKPSELCYFAMDLNTGEILSLPYSTTDTWGTRYPSRIVAQTEDKFLFASGKSEMELEYALPDGTMAKDSYSVNRYSFISAADFWNASGTATTVAEP